ncbi:Transmembrane emp24 domain-containing protein p24beta3 [Zostera marina]|uniref:Transmembrane emp24 domain-containing protein p24beta3 n=1 Tax=Zostera marina TaxID=29655 RepID=A0A0K9Q5R9_ZOSMR|nr:Transmembrane emp24 domain-containing protein p24beta3 [Zostera marina]
MDSPTICAIVLVVLARTFVKHASCLAVTVNDVECVYEYVEYDGDVVSGNFVVIDHEIFWGSDHPGINFEVTSPQGRIVHSIKGTSGDKFEFKVPSSGLYKFCFNNPAKTPETVSFYIHIGHLAGEHELTKDEHLNPINVKISKLRETLESVISEQNYLKARDKRHRHTNESTRKRVILYSLLEYLVLAGVSGLQVAYIRQLFSKSVAYNKF